MHLTLTGLTAAALVLLPGLQPLVWTIGVLLFIQGQQSPVGAASAATVGTQDRSWQ